jgi:hypothetical protein
MAVIGLTNAQLQTVYDQAARVPYALRKDFLVDLEQRLQRVAEIGDAIVYRAAVAAADNVIDRNSHEAKEVIDGR